MRERHSDAPRQVSTGDLLPAVASCAIAKERIMTAFRYFLAKDRWVLIISIAGHLLGMVKLDASAMEAVLG